MAKMTAGEEWALLEPNLELLNAQARGLTEPAPTVVDSPRRPAMRFTVETELEQESGRWIAEVMEVGAMQYGGTREEAIQKAVALALRVLADRVEHGEATPDELGIVAEPVAA